MLPLLFSGGPTTQTLGSSATVESDVFVAGTGGALRYAADAVPEWELVVIDPVTNTEKGAIGQVLDGTGWEDQWSDVGGGSFVARADNPDLTVLERRDVVRCLIEGRPAFQWLARRSLLERVQDDDSDPIVTWEGPGRLAALAAARIRPSRGFESQPIEENRSFGWPAVDYDDSYWGDLSVSLGPQGTPTAFWYGLADWPDPTAEWMWAPGATTDYSPTGDVYFRTEFTVAEGKFYTINFACDDRGSLYLDGQLLLQTQSWSNSSNDIVTETVVLSAGEHTLAVYANNNPGELGYNPAGVLVAVMPEGGGGSIFSSGAGWRCLAYPWFPPGVTFGHAMNRVLTEAQEDGLLPGLSWSFTPVVDSHGDPWPHLGDITAKTGSDLLAFLKAHTGADCEADMAAGSFRLDLYVAGGGGSARPIVLDEPGDENDPDSGLLLSQTNAAEGEVATAALVRYNGGWIYVDATPPGAETVETLLEIQHVTTEDDARRVALAELDVLGDIREQITARIRTDETAVPWFHYHPGDTIEVRDTAGDLVVERIVSLSATIADDELKVSPVLKDRILEDIERHEAWLKAMADGAARGQTNAATPPSLSNNPLPPRPVQELTWSLPQWTAETGGRHPFRGRITTRRWRVKLDAAATGTHTATLRFAPGGSTIASVTVSAGQTEASTNVLAVIDNGEDVEVVTSGSESFGGNCTLEYLTG